MTIWILASWTQVSVKPSQLKSAKTANLNSCILQRLYRKENSTAQEFVNNQMVLLSNHPERCLRQFHSRWRIVFDWFPLVVPELLKIHFLTSWCGYRMGCCGVEGIELSTGYLFLDFFNEKVIMSKFLACQQNFTLFHQDDRFETIKS